MNIDPKLITIEQRLRRTNNVNEIEGWIWDITAEYPPTRTKVSKTVYMNEYDACIGRIQGELLTKIRNGE